LSEGKPPPTQSALFRYIEELQGERPWGSFLDAGTGTHSIRWVSSLPTQRWVAVTGSSADAKQVSAAAGPARRAQDRIIVANWANPALLAGERFDTVLADYLIGAIEGFAPYFQEDMLSRLSAVAAGRLYIVGLEPYVSQVPTTDAGRLVWEIGRLRDACLSLAGERPYREYPVAWVEARLKAQGFRVVDARRFPIRYRAQFVNLQIDTCAAGLAQLKDRALADALSAHAEELRGRALAFVERENGIAHGFDYVVAAEPA
jgi:hypothetical protein